MENYDLTNEKSCFNPTCKVDFHIWDLPFTKTHTHKDYYEIFLVLSGAVDYEINGAKIKLKENTLSVVRPDDTHKFISPQGTKAKHLNIAIEPDLLKSVCNMINGNLFDNINNLKNYAIVEIAPDDSKLLKYLVHKINLVDIDNEKERKSQILTLVFNMLSLFKNQLNLNCNQPEWFFSLIQQINSVDFLDKSVHDLYDACPYSAPVIIREFKRQFNVKPVEYLTKIKLNYACNLLKRTNLTTLEISNLIGYESLSHFNHVFKKTFDITPIEYKKGAIKNSSEYTIGDNRVLVPPEDEIL